MSITQLEKLKQLASSDKTPEDIRKILIDIIIDADISYPYTPYPFQLIPIPYRDTTPIVTSITW